MYVGNKSPLGTCGGYRDNIQYLLDDITNGEYILSFLTMAWDAPSRSLVPSMATSALLHLSRQHHPFLVKWHEGFLLTG